MVEFPPPSTTVSGVDEGLVLAEGSERWGGPMRVVIAVRNPISSVK